MCGYGEIEDHDVVDAVRRVFAGQGAIATVGRHRDVVDGARIPLDGIRLATGQSLARLKNSSTVANGVAVTTDSRYAFVSSLGVGAAPGKMDAYDLRTLAKVARWTWGSRRGGNCVLEDGADCEVRRNHAFASRSTTARLLLPIDLLLERFQLRNHFEVLGTSSGALDANEPGDVEEVRLTPEDRQAQGVRKKILIVAPPGDLSQEVDRTRSGGEGEVQSSLQRGR